MDVKMDEQISLKNIDGLLFQLGHQSRELSQQKNTICQQIQVFRADIAEKKSYYETMCGNLKKLEEEVRVKQGTLTQTKENAKSMKETASFLLQHEQTLRAELESRKSSYNHDQEIYEERISDCTKKFKSYEDGYFQNPLAQKLLKLQAENEEIECRIVACDDQITMKEKELEFLTRPPVNSVSSGKTAESQEQEQEEAESKEGGDPSLDVSSLCINQKTTDQTEDSNAEMIDQQEKAQNSPTCHSPEEKADNPLWSDDVHDTSDPVRSPKSIQPVENDMNSKAEEEEAPQQDEEDPASDSQNEMENQAAEDEEDPPCDEGDLAVFPQASPAESNLQAFPENIAHAPPTPTFAFHFSPTRSPCQGAAETKSPAFLFSVNSNPSTPGFSGFGFDSSQDEESSFPFSASFFNEKKTPEKDSSCQKFLFEQPEQSGDFQFAFPDKSPQPASKDAMGDDFSFSFNF
ncbi:protein SIX6OS1 [Oryzias melastigma]|uniref:protein SIX6OS1 n=1 Tax=Oryzias melastigma TaxID=30732 RepID=UPI000CF81F5B|nr:protein SIX6OS1 [Oryzias melastigma]